jgi:uncharacterized membrane protein YdbT with pleckstrin-like domain
VTAPAQPAESPVWSGTPSQWVNFGAFVACGIVAVALVVGAALWSRPEIAWVALGPAAIAFWKWLTVKCMRIDVTTERVTVRTGVFSRNRWDMELYRVKDTTLHEPFLLRLVGLGNVALESSDKTTPRLVISAVRNAESLRQQLRANVERMRMAKRVRELDFE